MTITADVSIGQIVFAVCLALSIPLYWWAMLFRTNRGEGGRPRLLRDPLTYAIAGVTPLLGCIACGLVAGEYCAFCYEVDSARVNTRISAFKVYEYGERNKRAEPLATYEFEAAQAAPLLRTLHEMDKYLRRSESPLDPMYLVEFTDRDTKELLPEYIIIEPATNRRKDANIVKFCYRRGRPLQDVCVSSYHGAAPTVAELYRLIGGNPREHVDLPGSDVQDKKTENAPAIRLEPGT